MRVTTAFNRLLCIDGVYVRQVGPTRHAPAPTGGPKPVGVSSDPPNPFVLG